MFLRTHLDWKTLGVARPKLMKCLSCLVLVSSSSSNMEETVNLLNPSRRTRNSYDLAWFCPPVWLVNHWFPFFSALWKPYFSGGATLLPLIEEFLPFTRWNKVLTRSTGQQDLTIVLNELDYCELCTSKTTSLFRNLSTMLICVLLLIIHRYFEGFENLVMAGKYFIQSYEGNPY